MASFISAVMGLAVAAIILLLIRRDRLHVNHGMGWLAVALGFALLGFTPGLVDRMAVELGVSYPPVLALTGSVALLVIKILLMDIEHSHTETRNQRLIQRIGLLEADINELREQHAGDHPHSGDNTAITSYESAEPDQIKQA